jgi:hypothetical protein
VFLLALGAGSILWLRRWRQRYTAERPGPGETLEHYRTLLAHGQITREELERIENLLATPPPPGSDIADAPPPDKPPP